MLPKTAGRLRKRNKKYKESLKKGRAQELGAQTGSAGSGPQTQHLGDLCQFDKRTQKTREDRSDREITFNVDSGATRTVVKRDHQAVRGYKVHKDEQTGVPYNTAGKQQIKDEGRRILQVKVELGQKRQICLLQDGHYPPA